jgi:polyribonucleotide nucleotidyltransferase
LLCEELTFSKLISTVVIAEDNGNLICNPNAEQLKKSSFEFVVTASKENILMLEMFSGELNEDRVKEIASFAFEQTTRMIEESFSFLLDKKTIDKKLNLISIQNENKLELPDQIKIEISSFLEELFSSDSFE